jgi:hypothetical protein
MGEMRNSLVRKTEGKNSLGRPRHRWENIIVDLWKVEWRGMDCIYLAQDRDQWLTVLNTVMKFGVP